MVRKINLYFLLLFLEILGNILFLVNAKKIIQIPGLLVISILLISLPILLLVIYPEKLNFPKSMCLFLVIIPVLLINYIFFITQGTVVGFPDAHVHIEAYNQYFSENTKIDFSTQRGLSFVFVGLYLFSNVVCNVANINIILCASLIPPIINIMLVLLVYVIISRMTSHKLALLTTFFYAFQINVLYFGREYRTQTIGMLFLFSVIAIYMISKDLMTKNMNYSLIIIPLLFSIVLSSFVSFVFSLIVIFGILIINTLIPPLFHWEWKNNALNWQLLAIFILFFIVYLIEAGFVYETVINGIINMGEVATLEVQSKTAFELSPTAFEISYGSFITFMTNYIFSKLVMLSSLIFCIYVVIKKDLIKISFAFGFGLLTILYIFSYFFGALGGGRVYAVISLMLLFSMVWIFFQLLELSQKYNFSSFVKFFIIFLSVIYIITQVGQIPNYITGEKFPIRGSETVDFVSVWNADLPQYAAGDFINMNSINQEITTYSEHYNYYLTSIVKTKNRMNSENGFNTGSLVIIHDKFLGNNFPFRHTIPIVPKTDKNFNIIYSSNDYFALLKT